MTTVQLAAALKAQPFRPFVLRMADGQEVTVTHPEALAYGGGRTAVLVQPDDSIVIIDLLLVPALVMSAPAPPER